MATVVTRTLIKNPDGSNESDTRAYDTNDTLEDLQALFTLNPLAPYEEVSVNPEHRRAKFRRELALVDGSSEITIVDVLF